MAYNIVIGRNQTDRKLFGEKGIVNLGKLYVTMGQHTSLSTPVHMDVARTHVMMICGKRGSGKCLVEGTLIPLTNGSIVPIEKLTQNSPELLSLNDKMKIQGSRSEEFFERDVEEVVHVTLRSGREITLTPEHPLLTIKGWKPVEELSIGSRIATPRILPSFGNEAAHPCEINLLAYLIAEGHMKQSVLFSNGDKKLVDDFKYNLNVFDEKLVLRKDKKYHYRVSDPHFKGKILDKSFMKFDRKRRCFAKGSKTINQKRSIRLLLEEAGIWGLNSTKRFIPQEIFTLSKDYVSLFLRKLFSCDGSIYKTRKGSKKVWEISYCSSSKKMIHQVQHLLLRFGILSKIRHKNVVYKGRTFSSYELIISYSHRVLFLNEVGFFGKKKARERICLRELGDEQKAPNPNVDTIPKELWDVYRPSVTWAQIGRDAGYAHPKAMRERMHYSPSRQILLQIAVSDRNESIQRLATSDIFWDEIVSLELREGKFKVYDLSVPEHHNFVANDILVHNSYSASVIAEEISRLPADIKNKMTVLFFDTMGVFWTMKYPNTRQEDILREWGLEPEGLNVTIFTPQGFFDEYKRKGLPSDHRFALKTSELDAGDWCEAFDVKLTDPLGIFIERLIAGLRDTLGEYSIQDILASIKNDVKAEKAVRDAAENRFLAADSWGLFDKQGTTIDELMKPGSVNVLDISAYTNMAGNWSIKGLVIGLISRKLLRERVTARKEEELEDIKRQKSYFYEEKIIEKPMVWIMIDEAHEFLPKEGKTPATDALVQLLREGRQPGISLVLVTQQPGEIHKDVLTQSDIVLSHRLTAKKDIEALNEMMQSYLYTDLQGYLNALPKVRGASIILDDNSERIYPVGVHPKRSWHGGEAPSAVPLKKEIVFEHDTDNH